MAQTITDLQKLQARLNIGAAALLSLAPAFSTSTAYTAGDVVTYNGSLYVFTAEKAAGAWDDTKVNETTIWEVLQMAGGNEKKKFVLLGTIGGTCEYTFTNAARNAQFSPSADNNIAAVAISTAGGGLAGFKVGVKSIIKGVMVRSVKAEGLTSATAGAASLACKLTAVDDIGATVQVYNDKAFNIVVAEWNKMEYKDIDLQIPDMLPAGATGFMLALYTTSKFYVDDYNLQKAYVGEKVQPELVFEIEADKMVDVLTGTDIV